MTNLEYPVYKKVKKGFLRKTDGNISKRHKESTQRGKFGTNMAQFGMK